MDSRRHVCCTQLDTITPGMAVATPGAGAPAPADARSHARTAGGAILHRLRGAFRPTLTLGVLTGLMLAGGMPAEQAAAQSNVINIRLALINPASHPSGQALRKVSEMLATRSNGRIKMDVFPGGQLGSTLENLDQVSKGSIQMTILNPAITSQVLPQLGVFAAPELLPTLEAAYKAWASPVGQKIADEMIAAKNIRMLAPWYQGSWNLFTNRRLIHKCDDLRGMKLRVPPSPVLKHFFEQCGAGVVAIDFTEVYLSLSTGVIDGIPMPLATVESAKFHEVTKFATLHTFLIDLFHPLINERFWQSLSPDDRKLLVEAFAEGGKINDELAAKQEAGVDELLVKHNFTIDRTPDVESFVQAARKTWAAFEAKWGGKETIEKLVAAAK